MLTSTGRHVYFTSTIFECRQLYFPTAVGKCGENIHADKLVDRKLSRGNLQSDEVNVERKNAYKSQFSGQRFYKFHIKHL